MPFTKAWYENPEWLEYSTGGVPCSKQVADKYADQIFMSQAFLDNEKYTVDFTANNPNWAGVRAAFWPHIQALLNGSETAEEAEAGKLRNAVALQQDIASVGCAFGNGASVVNLVSMAEKDMYADKKSYYERHGLNRRRT